MSNFHIFSAAVAAKFTNMQANPLFVTTNDRDALVQHYLASFPQGTNPIFRERTEHDCSCCSNFIRNIGAAVGIQDGRLVSVWDIQNLPEPYQSVANAMASYVKSKNIVDIFRTEFAKYGNEKTYEEIDGKQHVWNHFVGNVKKQFVVGKEVAAQQGKAATNVDVLKRSLDQITIEALNDVLRMAQTKGEAGIYRGAEFVGLIQSFKDVKTAYDATENKHLAVWPLHGMDALCSFKNSSIGALVWDLSTGVELDEAVKLYESKVAPTNYKRTTSLITPKMAEEALDVIRMLDLEEALQRRHARLSDVSVNDVLWADGGAKKLMQGSLEALVTHSFKMKGIISGVQTMDIQTFMDTVLPTAQAIKILFKGNQQQNLVSVTAPQHADTGRLFKWNNDFAWSYSGEVTDAIKERVKKAGGNIQADLRVSLAWHNADDLDLHVITPSGREIYFANPTMQAGYYARSRRILDVDMNAGGTQNKIDPVENIAFLKEDIQDGTYKFFVHQYSRRSTDNQGFTLEFENAGVMKQFSWTTNGEAKGGQHLLVTVKNGSVVNVEAFGKFTGTGISQDAWGLKTETYVDVETIMHSPNYWGDNAVGNKHYFFIIRDCKNEEPARGIYNEFLRAELDKHRKVFEILGSRTKVEPAKDQLSGLGFSSTRSDEVDIQVISNNQTRNYKVQF